MAKVSPDTAEVNARILYWGIEGAGKSTNLHAAYGKLRPDHRGEIRQVPTRLDPTLHYEVLPISLGEIAGVRTQIEMITVPSGPEQAPTRKQLLDQVDGIVLVVDAEGDKADANAESFDELRQCLAAYGRTLEQVALVVQYNKRDLADPYALEDLHRKLDPPGAPVFEAVASEGTGVLQTLSTISKQVIRRLREQNLAVPPEPAAAAAEPAPPAAPEPPTELALEAEPAVSERLEEAILEEGDHFEAPQIEQAAQDAETLLERPWPQVPGEIERPAGVRLGPDFSIVSVGEASRVGDRSVRIPLVLGDAGGETTTLVLTLQLDALVDEDTG